jgi:hypothetical protein
VRRIRRYGAMSGGILGGLALILVTGCSSGDPAVSKEDVAKVASAKLAEQVGQAPDDVTCEEDLPAKVGSSVRCVITAGGEKIGMTATATSVDGSQVNFDVLVDDALMD